MKFSILILSSPADVFAGDTAWQYAQAVLRNGHELYRVFFYADGTHHGNGLNVSAQDAPNNVERWASLATDYSVDLVLCIASAASRGVLDQSEARRHERQGFSMHPAFTLSGLGQLADAQLNSDRLLTFGGR